MAIRDNGTVIDQVALFMERFVLLPDPSMYRLLASWVVATRLYHRFEYIAYVFAHSAEPQSGKSRLLEVLDLLVSNSSGILIAPTEAVLYRTADSTQLFDEVDSWKNRDALRGVLNAGFRNGGFVVRMREREGDYEAQRLHVYGPRALAGLGPHILDQTTLDRTLMLVMQSQRREERRERLNKRVEPEAERLRAEINEWVEQNGEAIAARYEQPFPYLTHFRDRTIDVTQGLAAVIEVAYQGHDALEDVRRELVNAIAVARSKQEGLSEAQRVMVELMRLAEDRDPLVGTATELAALCEVESPSSNVVSRTLRQYGFATKSVRKDGMPKHRYVLERAALEEIVARFAPEAARRQRNLGRTEPIEIPL